MKTLGIAIYLTTAFFLGFVVMHFFEITPWFLVTMFVVGHILIAWMVYSILTDKYTTKRKFKDWYEDHPIKNYRI